MDISNTVFLLGGSDLEMQTIKKHLLDSGFIENENLFDKNLSWGAKLSAYKKELENLKDKRVYGIELTEDIEPPKNYFRIDHHNELSNNPSSLEQVLAILNKKPSRYDKLVSANDVGYIYKLKEVGATAKEIEDIRAKDRKAQGVTQKDEEIAQKELKNLKTINGVYVVKTILNKFSPIVDRLYEKRPLIVYGKEGFTYYGDKVKKLVNVFKKEIKEQNAYYGQGFFGFDKEYLQNIDIENLLQKVIDNVK